MHPRIAFQYREFRFYALSRVLMLATQYMLLVAASQAVYEATRDPLMLGFIGLTLFAPKMLFTLYAGHIADHYDRRAVSLCCRCVQLLVAAVLIVYALRGLQPLWVLYLLVFIGGTINAFDVPASQAMITQVVAEPHWQNAITWNSSFTQLAFIGGPALGGWIYALGGPVAVFVAIAVMRLLSVWALRWVLPHRDHIERRELNWESVLAGVRYVRSQRVLLGAISLDLFAVLLGGVVALLPIFANDILRVGVWGLGLMRGMPAVGAGIMALWLAYFPPRKHAGKIMLGSVALYGIFTIFFGLSRDFVLSLVCLAALGAADMVSVVIRSVLVQTQTPAAMRGRVSAVNTMFIGASNEVGEFESGVTARLFGTVPAVLLGGIGTIAIVALWHRLFPELRRYEQVECEKT